MSSSALPPPSKTDPNNTTTNTTALPPPSSSNTTAPNNVDPNLNNNQQQQQQQQGGNQPGQYGPPQQQQQWDSNNQQNWNNNQPGQYGPPQQQWNNNQPGQYGPPQQQQWDPQQQQQWNSNNNQQQWNNNQPGQYGPPQQQWNQQQQQWGPPQQQWNQQQQQWGPPQQQWGPPQQQWGPPPPQSSVPPTSGTAPLVIGGQQQQQPGQYNQPPSTLPQQPTLPYIQHYIAGYPIAPGFNADTEASELYRATRGILNDCDLITKILAKRNPTERQQIKQAYTKKYGKDFSEHLAYGHYKSLVHALLMDPLHYDVYELYHSMKGAGTDERCLIEILVTRSNVQKQSIIPTFTTTWGKSLEAWITSDTSGNLRYFFIKLLSPRDMNPLVDRYQLENDSNKLYYAGEGKLGTDEKVFIDILTARSLPFIIELAKHYEANHKKHSLIKAIKSEFSGYLKTGLCAIVRYAQDPIGYFADVMKKPKSYTRTVVSVQHLLPEIKKKYTIANSKGIEQDIEAKASGDYKKLLLEVVKQNLV